MLKHSENLDTKEKVKLDLYKILRMNVLLSQEDTDELTLNKFKEASINLDKMLNDEYDKKISEMFYNTDTLEEEQERLKKVINTINERLDQRKSLLSDYRTVTSKELNDLVYIEKSNDIDFFEKRLRTIKEYLENSNLIESNEKELNYLENELSKEYEIKSDNENKNIKLEEELYNDFINLLYEEDIYNSLKTNELDKELSRLEKEIRETKEQKDTFITAFENLKLSGISGELELEYAAYVENSKRNYYYIKEKEIIIKIYRLLENKESEYSNLFNKREEIKELLKERYNLRKELNIKEKDILKSFSDMIYEQEQDISGEKEIVDNINTLTERIKLKENRLDDLRKEVKKPEVLSILKEYSLIETYDHETIEEDFKFDEPEEEIIEQEIQEDNEPLELLSDLIEESKEENEEIELPEKEYQINEIKECVMIPSMNFGLSRLKSINVMKRVADMLGISSKKEEEPTKELKPTENKPETNNQEELFWTQSELTDIKNDSPKEEKKPEEDIFIQDEMPSFKDEQSNIFETSNGENLIFPEPIMPQLESNPLPENKDDKFVWPESAETFDINGIFPN